jgi:hypothetical protein
VGAEVAAAPDSAHTRTDDSGLPLAVKEVQQALVEAGDRPWDVDLPDDEGGITPRVTEDASGDEASKDTAPPQGKRATGRPLCTVQPG